MKYQKGEFVQVPNISHLKGFDSLAQVLFMWLCVFADKDGLCFPSVKTLADLTGMSNKSVKRKTKLLIDAGLITKTIRKKNDEYTSNLYQILILNKK